MGMVLTAMAGQAPARQAALGAGNDSRNMHRFWFTRENMFEIFMC